MKPLKILITGALSFFLLQATSAYSADESFDKGWQFYQQGNFSEALKHWVPLAINGNAAAQFNLSTMYDDGRGVPKDNVTANYWLEKSMNAGYAPALHNLAISKLENDMPEEAIVILQRAADRGLSRSLYTLGKIYQYGVSVNENPAKAFSFVTLAAKAGSDRAQYNLGKMYRDGYGIEKDDTLSVKWFEKAALQGNGKAQSHLATRYGKGIGVNKDDILALKWSILAANAGNKTAILNIQALKKRMSMEDRKKAEQQAASFTPEKT